MVQGQDGVRLIYPSTTGGEFWFINIGNLHNDPRFIPSHVLDGDEEIGFKAFGQFVSMWAKTSTGFTSGIVPSNIDHGQLASQGYMLTENDWKDVEMTGYFKFEEGTADDMSVSMQARGAQENGVHNCAGTKYMAEINLAGKVRFGKKQWHLSQFNKDWSDTSVLLNQVDAIANGWFGFKFMIYNVGIGNDNPAGSTGVRLEVWIDADNSNTWVKAAETIDNGGWGNTDNCGITTPPDQIITWGGPLAVFNINNQQSIRFKLLSVREISPGGEFGSPVNPAGVITGVLPDVTTRVYASLKMHYRIGVIAAPTCFTETPSNPDPGQGGGGTVPPPPPPPSGTVVVTKNLATGYDIIQ